MKSYAIVIKNNTTSESAFGALIASSRGIHNPFSIERFNAVTPENAESKLNEYNLKWNYPVKGSVLDPWTELRKSAYGEKNPLRRVACSLSHFELWKKSVELNEPIIVLEHDALFINKLDPKPLIDSEFGVISLNSPIQATFAFQTYDTMIQSRKEELQPVPMLASKEVPQGLPGNSAYLIKPEAAKHLIDLCYKYGLWPNDAIMCQQLCKFLGVSKTYYTRVQNTPSTTSL